MDNCFGSKVAYDCRFLRCQLSWDVRLFRCDAIMPSGPFNCCNFVSMINKFLFRWAKKNTMDIFWDEGGILHSNFRFFIMVIRKSPLLGLTENLFLQKI